MIVLNCKNKETLKNLPRIPLLVPEESRNVDVHREGSVMDIHREGTFGKSFKQVTKKARGSLGLGTWGRRARPRASNTVITFYMQVLL